MSDNLRDRIAEVLRPIAAPDYGLTVHDLADAVIRELGLKHYCRECGGWGPMDD